MNNYLKLIDVNTKGPRYDVTPLFADFDAFSALVEDLLAPFDSMDFDCVAGIDALGFILGAVISYRTQKGFIPIRKGGKLPVDKVSTRFIDYSGKEKILEMRLDAIHPGARLLLVDEWIETGAQINAAIKLIDRLEGIVVGIAAICMDRNVKTDKLEKLYKINTVWVETQG